MNPRPVALLAALLPMVAVNLSYLVAARYGLVDWCFPYLDSCSSISATGRYPPASYLFRATMLPAAVILAAYWWLSRAWLAAPASGGHQRQLDWMCALGLAASLGLVAYVAVLGEAGEQWQRQRRIGAVLYFSLTFLAQLLLAGQLRRRARQLPRAVPWARCMFANCLVLLGLGLGTVLWNALDPAGYDAVEDALEWILALLLQLNYLAGYLLWRRDGWQLAVARPGNPADNPGP
jgi:Frag1/DRAM/Sfk1 family